MDLAERLEKIFFPWDICCCACGEERVERLGLCASCANGLHRPEGLRCPVCLDRVDTDGFCGDCLKHRPDYERLYTCYIYEEPLKSLIRAFKFHNARYLKHAFLSMAEEALPADVIAACDVFVPVPQSRAHFRERGYNQAEVLAKAMGKAMGKAVNSKILVRKKDTQMSKMTKEERQKAVKKEYGFIGTLHGETVLLIDDVVTTGGTVRACAEQLKKAGAGKIYVFAVARTDKKY